MSGEAPPQYEETNLDSSSSSPPRYQEKPPGYKKKPPPYSKNDEERYIGVHLQPGRAERSPLIGNVRRPSVYHTYGTGSVFHDSRSSVPLSLDENRLLGDEVITARPKLGKGAIIALVTIMTLVVAFMLYLVTRNIFTPG